MGKRRQWTVNAEDLAFGAMAVIAAGYLALFSVMLLTHETVSENMVCFEDIKND